MDLSIVFELYDEYEEEDWNGMEPTQPAALESAAGPARPCVICYAKEEN